MERNKRVFYLGTLKYMIKPITENIKFGIHAEIAGSTLPPLAILWPTTINIIYTNANAKPNAICKPTPSLDLREETITPMIVRIIIENG